MFTLYSADFISNGHIQLRGKARHHHGKTEDAGQQECCKSFFQFSFLLSE